MSAIPLEIVTHEDLQMNERLRDYIEKKIDRLVRSLSNVISIRVDLSYNPAARNVDERAKAQITIRGKRLILRTEEYADDIFAAMDKAVDTMERRIERVKGKRYRRPVKHAELVADLMESEVEEATEPSRIAFPSRTRKRPSSRWSSWGTTPSSSSTMLGPIKSTYCTSDGTVPTA